MSCEERLPTLFVSHGGGPLPIMERNSQISEHLASLASHCGGRAPSAILVVSAHWESAKVKITTAAKPLLLFDYDGFPPETYAYRYDCPGPSPALGARIQSLLSAEGIPCEGDAARGLDHGVFVPLLLAWPSATIPVLQLSLHSSLDPKLHLRMGRALAPLRDEGVLIVGSGSSVHNLEAFFSPSSELTEASHTFDAFLARASAMPSAERAAALTAWEHATPVSRLMHPREEHLLPLMVAAGAAGEDKGHRLDLGLMMKQQMSSFVFVPSGRL